MAIADQRNILAPLRFETPEQVEAHWRRVEAAQGGYLRDRVLQPMLETGETRPARVDHGRWLIDCECGAGCAAWVGNPRAACLNCGRIYEVSFPSETERLAAEALLDERPEENQNWTPGDESVASLRDENVAARNLGLIG